MCIRARGLALGLAVGLAVGLGLVPGSTSAEVGDASQSVEDGSAARISGRVVDERGRPVANFVVAVDDVLPVPAGRPTVTRTRSDGTYTMVVEPGIYRVQLRHYEASFDYQRRYVEKWWPDAREYADAVDVVARPGSHVRGVDATLKRGAKVRGVVSGPGGGPAAARVTTYRWGEGQWRWFNAGWWQAGNGSGRFEISGLPSGTYRFEAHGTDGETCSSETGHVGETVTVRAGEVVNGHDFQLAPQGAIHGVVHPLDPHAGTSVKLWRLSGAYGWIEDLPVQAGEEGEFRFDDLCPGRYRVSFSEPWEYWNDAGDFPSADDIVVAPDSDESISAILDPGGTIEGRLLLPGDVPAAWTAVRAYRRTGTGGWEQVAGGGTDDSGVFAITDLRPGTYRLRFGTTADRDRVPLVEEYWPDSSGLVEARDVVLATPLSSVDIGDAQLRVGAEVGGEVREAGGGATVGSAPVTLYQRTGGTWSPVHRQLTVHRTGHYHFSGLEPGRYRLGVVDRTFKEHAPEFWPAAHAPAGAQDFVIDPGDVRRLDLDLDLGVRNLKAPRVRGAAEVGGRLRAGPGVWSPFRTRLAFQWLANGRPIPGAHAKVFRPRPRDVGKRLSVRVTGAHAGYVAERATSKPTRPVRAR